MAGCQTGGALAAKLVAALIVVLLAGDAARGDVIYSNDFNGAVGSEWSNTSTATSPSGQTFLGRFNNQTITLSLAGLASHTDVNLSFDLYLIGVWDGKAPSLNGPDRFRVRADGDMLLDSTFSNITLLKQDYPSPFGSGNNAGRTGSTGASLGYPLGLDSVYHFDLTLAHSASTLTLDFRGSGLLNLALESWGIDNVTVESLGGQVAELVPEPGSLMLGLVGATGALLAWRRRPIITAAQC